MSGKTSSVLHALEKKDLTVLDSFVDQESSLLDVYYTEFITTV